MSATRRFCARWIFPLLLAACAHSPSLRPAPQMEAIRRVRLPLVPKYFFKPVGDRGEIAFSAMDPVGRRDLNLVFDPATGRSFEIPGVTDPIGLYGKNLVTVPVELTTKRELRTEIRFYDLSALREKGPAAAPIPLPACAPRMAGRYQSLGLLRDGPSEFDFRVLTDERKGGAIADFRATLANGRISAIRPLGKPLTLCRNLRDAEGWLNLKLPMLAKDGASFSGYDLSAQMPMLYRIRGENCEEKFEPAWGSGEIGKFDFSLDSSVVAAHYSGRIVSAGTLTFGVPPESAGLNLVLARLTDRAVGFVPIPRAAGVNLVYPAFGVDGRLLAFEYHADHADLILLDPGVIRWVPELEMRETLRRLRDPSDPLQGSIESLARASGLRVPTEARERAFLWFSRAIP